MTLDRNDLLEIFKRHPKEAAHLYEQIDTEMNRRDHHNAIRVNVAIAFMPKHMFPRSRASLILQRAWSNFQQHSENTKKNPFYAIVAPYIEHREEREKRLSRRRQSMGTPSSAGKQTRERSSSDGEDGEEGGDGKTSASKLGVRMDTLEGRLGRIEGMLGQVLDALQPQNAKPASAVAFVDEVQPPAHPPADDVPPPVETAEEPAVEEIATPEPVAAPSAAKPKAKGSKGASGTPDSMAKSIAQRRLNKKP